MKAIATLIVVMLGIFSLPDTNVSADQPQQEIMEKAELDKVGIATLGLSVLGAIMIAIPPLSIVGLLFALGGLGLAIFAKKRIKRKLFRRLAIIISSITLTYFLAAFLLILFY
ncbi:MAG: hypothetical protein AAFY71_20485 [Bacteroidota bacterium]